MLEEQQKQRAAEELIAISIPVTALNLADSPPFVNKLNNSTRRPSVFFA